MQALHLPPLETSSSKPLFSFSNPSNPAAPSDLIYTASPSYPVPSLENHPAPHYYQYRQHRQAAGFGISNEVLYLVQVHTTALTKGELTWVEVLLPSRFTTDRGPIPGHDVVGTIERVYQNTSGKNREPRFRVGDLVWGLIDFEYDGAAAGHVVVRESEISLAPRTPEVVSDQQWQETLATLPLSALTAWQALFEYGGIAEPNSKEDQHSSEPVNILITGSSGSVGVYAVQLAHLAANSSQQDLTITAISSESNAQFVKDLGADNVVVYNKSTSEASRSALNQSQPMLAQIPAKIDLLLDLTGPNTDSTLLSVLQSPAITIQSLVSVAGPVDFSSLPGLSSERKIALQEHTKVDFFIVRPEADQLSKLGRMIEEGQLQAFVDEVFSLENGKDAMEYVESRQRARPGDQEGSKQPRRGKVVLKI